jgi:O-antigen/teichoic acid export membrane protein
LTHEIEGTRHDLKGLVVRGLGWMLASQTAIQIFGIATAVVVARFLGPREVGLAAEALVFATLGLVIADFGIASAVVQREKLSEEDKSTAFWASIGLAAILTLIGIGLSWPIAGLYGEPRVQPLFAAFSFIFLLTAFGIVQGAVLTRELRFRSLELRTIVATAAGCTTAIALAVLGFGAWAIVAQTLIVAGVSTALLWRASIWRPRGMFSIASLREMAGYASHVFGSHALHWGTTNVDNLLIGRFLGASPLGAYTIAFSLMITPVKRIAYPVMQVFFPAFSQMRDRQRIARTWLRATRMVALIVVPLMLGLIVVAPDLVDAVFGDEWRAAVPVIQILAPVGLIQSMIALNDAILQAVAQTRTLFRFTAVLSIVTVAAFGAGIPWGLEGVAWAYLIVTVTMQPIYLWLTTRAVGLTPRDWLRSIARVLQAGAVMLLIVVAAREVLLGTDLDVGQRLALLVLAGALAYVPLVAWRVPEAWAEVRGVRRRRGEGQTGLTPESSEARV